ncbi:terpene synthase family protein [Streptomyces sp. MNP-20]|uniref:terpene synthase family protein n=1 Tax=Streptomyces sp. MNP-20 TaxID=2721165 RepID=UPI001557C12B|nr:terpene synthase family protein [Streptomyces sp. MNP-20]
MPAAKITMLPEEFLRDTTPEIHPGAAQADDAFVAFAHRMGITRCERDADMMRSFAFGVFTGWCYPALPQAQLDILTQWHYWLTITDDVADATDQGGPHEATRLCHAILEALTAESPPAGDGPAVVSIHDLWRRTAPSQSPQWRQRARLDLALYLHQYTEQRHNREANRPLTPDEYQRLRRDSVGLDFNADVLEAVHGIQIPEPLFATWQLRELRNCFIDANSWFNDYYSFEREARSGEQHNLALVLAVHEQIEHDRALERVLEMIQDRLRRFLILERLLLDTARALGYDTSTTTEISRYAQVLRDYTYGHVAWSSTSSRYNERQLRATSWA